MIDVEMSLVVLVVKKEGRGGILIVLWRRHCLFPCVIYWIRICSLSGLLCFAQILEWIPPPAPKSISKFSSCNTSVRKMSWTWITTIIVGMLDIRKIQQIIIITFSLIISFIIFSKLPVMLLDTTLFLFPANSVYFQLMCQCCLHFYMYL